MGKHWYSFDDIPKSNTDLYKFITYINRKLNKEHHDNVYFDNAYNYKQPKKRLQVKITSAEVANKIATLALQHKLQVEKTKNGFLISPINISLYISGGIRGTGMLPRHGKTAKIPTTSEQELASVYYISQMVEHKQPTLEKINKEIGFEFDDAWLHNFYEHYKALTDELGTLGRYKIYHDANKSLPHNITIETARKLGMKDSKDNWNPSDIWLMDISKQTIINETDHFVSLTQFNSWMEEKYDNKQIIGVSLKKIGAKKTAKAKVINNRDLKRVSLYPKRVLFDPQQTNFIFETTGSVENYNIRVGYKSASDSLSIYLEGRMAGSSVQLGAVSSKIVQSVFKENDIEFKPKLDIDKMDKVINTIKGWYPVVYKGSIETFSELTGFEQQRAMYLTYFLYAFMKVKDQQEMLETFYYSSLKQNKFSSIHLKVS